MLSNTKAMMAHLHWAHADNCPCFCRPTIDWRLDRHAATPETLAAIFGLTQPKAVQVQRLGDDEPLALMISGDGDPFWPLEPDQHYQVTVVATTSGTSSTSPDDNGDKVICIKNIFAHLPGTTEDEKSARLLDGLGI